MATKKPVRKTTKATPAKPKQEKKVYTEEEVQQMLQNVGVAKEPEIVAVTLIGVLDNGQQVVQSFYDPQGLYIGIQKKSEIPPTPPEQDKEIEVPNP